MTPTDPPAADGLTCPLCRYDLRGLTEPRCPECGFRFTWAELADEHRHGHRYLFEHAKRKPLRALWSTYWRTCRPRRFWRDVSPANPVAAGRVVLYWLLATVAASAALAIVLAAVAATRAPAVLRDNESVHASYLPAAGQPGLFSPPGAPRGYGITAAELAEGAPLPPSWTFFRAVWREQWGDFDRPQVELAAIAVAVVLSWPWLTWAALLLFQASMRRAHLDGRHVLRVAVYGCDFGLLLATLMVAAAVLIAHATGLRTWLDEAPAHGVAPLLGVVLACAAVATYRLSFAYARYLRFDRPVLTVLAAQAVVVLFVGVVLTRLA